MANMLYNGVELPDINTVWTDKETYPYAFIVLQDMSAISAGIGMYNVYFTTTEYGYNGTRFYPIENGSYINYQVPANQATVDYINANGGSASQDSWLALRSGSLVANQSIQFDMKWSNFDIDGFIEASDPVPVGGSSHVTISSGDGYALYNGVKLPTLPVWDKTAYPYTIIADNDGLYAAIALSSPLVVTDDALCARDAGNWTSTYMDNGEWLAWESAGSGSLSAGDTVGLASVMFWSNHDILNSSDQTTYLAASDPIPLDGMTVIEWDGVTDGLEVIGDTPEYALVSTFPNIDGTPITVLYDYDGSPFVVQDSDDNGYVDTTELYGIPSFMVAETGVQVVMGYGENIPDADIDAGLYFVSASGTAGHLYAQLFAYTPASTEPEEPEDTTKKDFWNGVACGLCGSGTPNFSDTSPFGVGYITGCKLRALRERKPIAYLYNGVQLPPLPEWDGTDKPYEMITHHYTDHEYYMYRRLSGKLHIGVYPESRINYTEWYLGMDKTPLEWRNWGDDYFSSLYPIPPELEVIWANYDVYNAEGAIVVSPSDPVPVYE